MKEWKKPTIGNLSLAETKEPSYCSAQAETFDGHHTSKCHHNLPGINASNCQYFTRPGGMCTYDPNVPPTEPDIPTS